MNQKIINLKNYIQKKLEKIKKFDYIVVFIAVAFILFLLNSNYISLILAAYIYSAFYYLIKSVIVGKSISFMNIFVIFVLGFSALLGCVYSINLLVS